MQRIDFRDVIVRYDDVLAVRRLSLTVEPRECLALLGPSGCGKTTLLRVLGGFVPYEGSVEVDGQAIDALPAHRRRIGIVFQDYALFPHMTVRENIGFGLRMRKAGQAAIAARTAEALAMLRLDGLGERYPGQLSGGQQQRVALARAIAIDPAVLLLDEPLGALDKKLREEMQVELRELQQRIGITTIFVTHDQEEALSLADRIAVMQGGEIQQIGSPAEIYDRPANRFVSEFIGYSNFITVDAWERSADGFRCRTGDGSEVRVANGPAASPGDEGLDIAVRPERLRLELPGPAGQPAVGNRLSGDIVHVNYLGATTQVRVRLAGGEIVRVDVQNGGERSAFPDCRPGRAVQVAFDAADALLMRR